MTGCECNIEIKDKHERNILLVLLSINAVMFVVEITFGLLSDSTALIADSLDMLADATVYGIGLYAVGKALAAKVRAAHLSGVFQIILGLLVCIDVLRRFIWGSEPESVLMMLVGLAALVANLICFKLISKHRYGEVHMRASWVFSKNDVIANLGIITGGGLVELLGVNYPDLIIGLLISLLVVRGGMGIIKDANSERQAMNNSE